jgi:hypothetical protein
MSYPVGADTRSTNMLHALSLILLTLLVLAAADGLVALSRPVFTGWARRT